LQPDPRFPTGAETWLPRKISFDAEGFPFERFFTSPGIDCLWFSFHALWLAIEMMCCSCSSALVWAMGAVIIDDVESGDEYGLLPRVGIRVVACLR